MRRARPLAALLLATPLLLTAAPPRPALAQAESREGIFLQNQILQLRQELDQLRRSGGSALGGPAMVAPPPSRGGGGGAPSGELVGQLLDRVSGLEEEVRRMRGRLEESEFRNRQLSQAVEKMQGDIDFRLQQLEGQGGAAPAARPAPPAPAPARPAPPPVAAPATPAPPPVAAGPRPPERAIAEGQAALGRRDFAAAEAAAREALAARNSPRATDAQVLLGDALTGKRDFAGAALAYNDAYTRSRSGPRAPEALIGLASSFASLGSRREACDTLDDLRSNFPNLRAPLAERAAEARRRAGCR
jgi:TolA-binding protein